MPANSMHTAHTRDLTAAVATLTAAALDRRPVSGWTHNYYRYPARFSPRFAATAIEEFSNPGDIVLDPYMGGGTAIVEGLAAGRYVIGNDLNSLATFVSKVKITPLSSVEASAIEAWVEQKVPTFNYRVPAEKVAEFIDPAKTKNLALVRARFIKKAIAVALASIEELASVNTRDFAKCALLRVGQWALDGRSRHTPLTDFREKLATVTEDMLSANALFAEQTKLSGGRGTLFNGDACSLPDLPVFQNQRAALVVTSPPYPGVHVLYHRWQVDGRRETDGPYWISGCNDGQGASYYNFGDRRQAAAENYFRNSLQTLRAIRRVMRDGGYIVQLVAFNKPEEQLPRYLENMQLAGFVEVSTFSEERIWRQVPNRKWHALLRGQTHGAREVVLVHRVSGAPTERPPLT
jgi:DNA modification methylase